MWDFFGNLFVASLFGFLQFIIAFYAAGYYEYHSNSGERGWFFSTCIPSFFFHLIIYFWTDSLVFSSLCYVIYAIAGFFGTQWGLESYLKSTRKGKDYQ